METYKVVFLPDRKEIDVEEGTVLMDAATQASVFINSLCGGEGVCGRCRVQIINSKVKADKNSISFLSREEIREGYVLACQTKIRNNLEVLIPPESRLEAEQILMERPVVDYSNPGKISVARVPNDPLTLYEPLVQKIYLELEEPSSDDNVSDIDRIIRLLKKKTGYENFETTLSCLRGLATRLRENHWKVTVTIALRGEIWRILQVQPGDTTEKNYGLAVDIGTTTVVAQLIHLKTGNVVGIAGSHNLQARYGEDVISRMVYACGRENGLNPLHEAIINNINNLIKTLTEEKQINQEDITALVAAGNTTMSHLFLSLIPCSIRMDPYVPTARIFPQITADELNIDINGDGIIETVPNVASYIGGDIVAGIIACGMADRPETNILIDVGTNGEIALGNNEWLVCCSASAGPAFEGGGIRHGMRATRGAIERVIIEDGELNYRTIGKSRPMGICGSGLIDCIYEFVKNGIIDRDGRFIPSLEINRLRESEGVKEFIIARSDETESGKDLTITESDIANIIRSKGAVFAAIKSLADYVGLEFDAIDNFFVAGGFGSYLDIPRAIGIGLLPDIEPEKIHFIGNSSLMGSRIALLSRHAYERSIKIAGNMTNIELSTHQPFMDEYVAAMFLPHTDLKLFPSVNY